MANERHVYALGCMSNNKGDVNLTAEANVVT